VGIPKYQKIFTIGHRTIQNLFKGEVEVTEKIDGSQFGFGKVNGDLHCRSRSVSIVMQAPDKMFKPGVDYVKSIQDRLLNNRVFYGEFLRQPKHNVLSYNRTPANGIALFGILDLETSQWADYGTLTYWANELDIDVVPLIYQDTIDNPEDLLNMLDRESYLGGPNIEGLVVKNYNLDNMIGDVYIPFLTGKYVSEKFKERHSENWKRDHTAKGRLQNFIDSFHTEARWEKAIQHMREAGTLQGEPRDIGELIKEIKQDIIDEDLDEIKDFLWKNFSKQLLSTAIKGFPEWYKEKLLRGEVE
jgi:hypothetical protein